MDRICKNNIISKFGEKCVIAETILNNLCIYNILI